MILNAVQKYVAGTRNKTFQHTRCFFN